MERTGPVNRACVRSATRRVGPGWVWHRAKGLAAGLSLRPDRYCYRGTPRPSIESMFDYMYADLPEALEEQRDTALSYATDDEHQ